MKFIAYFLMAVAQTNMVLALYVPSQYVAPDPEFEVFSSGGFAVSIPHVDGIQVFSFHGKINSIFNRLESGQFSKDVQTRSGGRWVFEDRSVKLREGDVIYFWFLVVKDNLGYRYDDGKFVVRETVEEQPHAPSAQPTTQSNSDSKTGTSDYNPMCETALNLSSTVHQLTGDVKMLNEINDVLKDILSKDDSSARTLRFEGILPPFDDAAYTAQIILQEKLGLRIPVVNATRESDRSITFQVASLDDKIYVIRTAKEKLMKTNSKIMLSY